jgi:uncharacterized protein
MASLARDPVINAAIDCDVHHAVPDISALFPYLPQRWTDYCVEHAIDSLSSSFYPPRIELSTVPEARRSPGEPGSDPAELGAHVFGSGADVAILNCLYGVQAIHNEDWAAAMVSALNDWQAATWLTADRRMHASIVVGLQNPERAAEEIRRCADNPGFVQVLLLAFTETPLGRRHYWPIFDAASAAGLPVAVHPGVASANPWGPSGWSSYFIEDYAGVAGAMQSQLTSMVCEGVFQKFPDLTVVLLESGVTWLPSLMWRLDKNWKGLRREIPWLDLPPSEVIRSRVRLTVAPFDGPPQQDEVMRLVEQIGSERMLLYASDYPHWHYRSAEESVLRHLSAAERENVLRNNALEVYRFNGAAIDQPTKVNGVES